MKGYATITSVAEPSPTKYSDKDITGRPCTKMLKNLFEDVTSAKDMQTSKDSLQPTSLLSLLHGHLPNGEWTYSVRFPQQVDKGNSSWSLWNIL